MKRPRWGTALSAILLISAVGLAAGGSWLAIQLIVNPASVRWISQILPSWGEFATVRAQTLSEIEAEVRRDGQQLGQPIHFSTYPGLTPRQVGFDHLLLPILQPVKHCALSCTQIAELRVYQPKAVGLHVAYELLDHMMVAGPAELEAIAPLSSSLTRSTRRLPLTEIDFIAGKAPAGLWLQLSGEWQRGSRVLYGQVVEYDPSRARLSLLQAWSSPAGQLPRWQQITASPIPELVVNQSVGLEPQFQVFQLERSQSLIQSTTLEPISLTAAALNHRSYKNALLLARNGLWSLALAKLEALKQAGSWSTAAQAQLDVIALHARVTQSQADQDWASPTQQVLAQITDGRWSQSLAALKSAARSGYDIHSLLVTNSDRLWQRVEAALRVAPQADLQAWGLVLLSVRQNPQQALSWFRKQPNVKPELTQSMQPLLALLDPSSPSASSASPEPAVTKAATAQIETQLSLIGLAMPLTAVQPRDWSPLVKTVALTATPPPQQSWYQIEVSSLQIAQIAQSPIEQANKPAALQQATLKQAIMQLPLQLVVWQNTAPVQMLPLSIKAIRLKQGQIWLLGHAAPATPAPTALVAVTPNVTSLQPTANQTLGELMLQPDWQPLIPQLWQALAAAQLIPDPTADPLATMGQWSVQRLELTGDQTPEVMLTLEPDTASLRTVIFSNQKLLYSDLQLPNQALVGLAASANQTMLLLKQNDRLELRQWSAQRQQFVKPVMEPVS